MVTGIWCRRSHKELNSHEPLRSGNLAKSSPFSCFQGFRRSVTFDLVLLVQRPISRALCQRQTYRAGQRRSLTHLNTLLLMNVVMFTA